MRVGWELGDGVGGMGWGWWEGGCLFWMIPDRLYEADCRVADVLTGMVTA